MDANASKQVNDTQPRLCKTCNLLFPGWAALRRHKKEKREAGVTGHVHCRFCGQDFVTLEAEMQHIRQNHAHEQDLTCPGCGREHFVRLAGLVSHIEQGECLILGKSDLATLREEKLAFPRQLATSTNEPIKHSYAQYVSPRLDTSSVVSRVESERAPHCPQPKDFPQLPGASAGGRSQSIKGGTSELGKENLKVAGHGAPGEQTTAWQENKTLFPDAPAAQKPTEAQLKAATGPNARMVYLASDRDHPSHQDFNAASYYNQYSDKYDCPKCNKVLKNHGGVVAHLKSTAHGDTTYRCPYCLRIFKSLTAMVSHAESQGTFCQIRKTKEYSAYMDQLSAGLVDVAETPHEDGTVAYETSKNVDKCLQKRGQSVAGEGSVSKKEKYWADKEVNW